jgi:two-component system sensor histidine kinase KdpD
MRTRGVLAIVPENKRMIYLPEQRQLLDTFASQIAIAIERVHYVEIAQDALVTMESERLRNAVLGAISHDLNTPLTTIVATSELLKQQTIADDPRYQYVTMLYEQSIRMRNLVVNLLDMARLQSGKVKLKKEWQLLEEVVGTALRAMKETLVAHQIIIDLPSDLPLLEFDAVLIDRVLCNLLDNVAKYVPSGGKICISAEKKQQEVWVSVADDGPGLPENSKDQIFEKFTRGEKESTKAGVGLGLSICKAIIEAHDGKIWANNKAPQGAIFTFSIPLGIPPELPPTDEIQP